MSASESTNQSFKVLTKIYQVDHSCLFQALEPTACMTSISEHHDRVLSEVLFPETSPSVPRARLEVSAHKILKWMASTYPSVKRGETYSSERKFVLSV